MVKSKSRDEEWKERTIRNTSKQFQQEFECEFLGSVNTLISPAKIKNMTFLNPIQSNGGLDVYEQPVKAIHMFVRLT